MNPITRITFFIFAAVVAHGMVCAAQVPTADQSVAALAEGSWRPTTPELQGFVEQCRERILNGQAFDWESARAVINNRRLHSSLRTTFVRLTLRHAEDQVAAAVLDDVCQWVPSSLSDARLEDRSSVSIAHSVVSDATDLELGSKSAAAMSNLLRAIVTSETLPLDQLDEVANLVGRFSDHTMLSPIAYSVIHVHGHKSDLVGTRIVDWLQDPELQQLRDEFLSAPLTTADFNYAVPGALADRGDIGILDGLRHHRDWARNQLTSERVSALKTHARQMQFYMDLIDVQQDPRALLTWVSDDETRGGRVRAWAARRALELGLAPDEVLAAVLRLNQSVLEWAKQDGEPGSFGYALAVKKQVEQANNLMVENGILTPEQVPNLELTSSVPTPRR